MSIRVVYDTPMLVPRDEAVPALVINPHNPPPWLQNSTAAQPQIIYVQQHQNYVQQQQPQQQQTYVQPIDQNQIYLQQYAYQNPQMFLQNYDQLRQIQIIPNVVQIPANHDPNDPNRMLTQTYVQTQQNMMQNHAPVQNQVSIPITPAPVQIVPEKSDPNAQKLKDTRMPNIVQMNPQIQDTQLSIQQPINNCNQFLPRPNQQLRPRMARPQASNQQRPTVRNVRSPRFAYRPIQPRLRYQVPSVTVQKRFVQSSNMPNVINVSNVVGTTPTSSNIVGRLPTNMNVVGPTSTNTNVVGALHSNTNVVGTLPTNVAGIIPTNSNIVGRLPTNMNFVGPTTTNVVGALHTNTNLVGPLPRKTSVVGTIPTNTSIVGTIPTNTTVAGTIPTNPSLFRPISTYTNTVGPTPTNTNIVGPITTNTNIVGPPNINFVPSKVTNKSIGPSNTNISASTSFNSTITESSTITPLENKVSRKRKSESPDEIQNKLNVLAINNSPILMGQLVTAPVEEISNNDKSKMLSAINTVSTQVQKEDLLCHTPSTHGLVNQINLAQNQLKEKLVRNTVYTQARGRILNVKSEVKIDATSMEVQTENIETTKDSADSKLEDIDNSETKLKDNDKSVKIIEKEDENIRTVNKGINRSDATDEMKLTEKDFVLTHVLDGFVIQESNIAFPIRKPKIERTIRLSSEALELNALDAEKDLENVIPSVAILVTDKLNKSKDLTEPKIKENTGTAQKHKGKSSSKHKSKEKTETKFKDNSRLETRNIDNSRTETRSIDNSRTETRSIDNSRTETRSIDNSRTETRSIDISRTETRSIDNSCTDTKSIDNSSPGLKPKENSCVRLDNEKSNCAGVDRVDNDNPFRNLKPPVVKGWTMEQLTSHLSEHGWKETSSAFFEHEIDGESLLLVSKSQLVAIGVKEEHADVIMNFMST